jgi:hypothetical protein
LRGEHFTGTVAVASCMDATQRHVDVRVPRVVVVDRYPLELRPELVLERGADASMWSRVDPRFTTV